MENERKTFLAVVTGNSLQKSAKQGTPSVAIKYRTQYDVEAPETPLTVNLIDNLWLTYKCMERTIGTLQEVFGWKGHNITDFEEPILVGKKVHLVCELEEWEGQERWKVVFTNRAGGFKKLETEELSSLVKEVQPMIDKMLGKCEAEAPDIINAEFSEANDGGLTEQYPNDEMPF